MTERVYFLAHGESEVKVRDFFTRRQEAIAEATELAKSFGGRCTVGSRRIAGVVFPDGAPEGWTRKGITADGASYFMPLRRSKAGKEMCARLTAIKIPDGPDLHSLFTSDGGHFSSAGAGFAIHYISAEIAKGNAIISVPAGMDFAPPDSTPLKMSEYWAMKEGAGA